MNPKVDFYFTKAKKWEDEFIKLREIVLSCGLQEELKWGNPCYMLDNRNIVLIHGFKEYCALLFFKGALMKDPNKLLVQQTQNVQAARQLRFSGIDQIRTMESTITAYIKDAVRIEKSGKKVELKETKEFPMPAEFKAVLAQNAALKKAFTTLTPGRQRGYLLYFSQAKQSKTRESRIEKYMKHILAGKGLED